MADIKTGKCMNFGRCSMAKTGAEQNVLSSEPFLCSECQLPLTEIAAAPSSSSSQVATALAALLIVALAGAAAYLFFSYRELNQKVVNLEKTEKELNQEISELVETDSLLRVRIKVTADSLVISQKELADLRVKIKNAYQTINFLERAKQLTREEAKKYQTQLSGLAVSLEKYTGQVFETNTITDASLMQLIEKQRIDFTKQINDLKAQLSEKEALVMNRDSQIVVWKETAEGYRAKIKPEYRVDFTKPVLLSKKTFGDDTYRVYFDIIIDESDRVVKPGGQFRAFISPTTDKKTNPSGEVSIQNNGNKLFVDYIKDNFEGAIIVTSNDKTIGSYSVAKTPIAKNKKIKS